VAVADCAVRFLAVAAPIGQAYLQTYASEADGQLLTDLLVAQLAAPAGDVLEQLAAAVRDDFCAGRVVEVEGWLLARTEARLCAVAYLNAARGRA
jgi:hypothetical protein